MFLLIIGPLLSVDATSVVGAIVVISALVSIMVDVAADNWAIAATTVVGAIVVFSAEFRSWLMWVEHF